MTPQGQVEDWLTAHKYLNSKQSQVSKYLFRWHCKAKLKIGLKLMATDAR